MDVRRHSHRQGLARLLTIHRLLVPDRGRRYEATVGPFRGVARAQTKTPPRALTPRQNKTLFIGCANESTGSGSIEPHSPVNRTQASMVSSLVQVRNSSLSLFAGPMKRFASLSVRVKRAVAPNLSWWPHRGTRERIVNSGSAARVVCLAALSLVKMIERYSVLIRDKRLGPIRIHITTPQQLVIRSRPSRTPCSVAARGKVRSNGAYLH